jgi:hypothetical protein
MERRWGLLGRLVAPMFVVLAVDGAYEGQCEALSSKTADGNFSKVFKQFSSRPLNDSLFCLGR